MSSLRGSVVSPHEPKTYIRKPDYGPMVELAHCTACGCVLDVEDAASIRKHEDFHAGLAKLAAALSARAVS